MSHRELTIEELVTFNDELIALSKAGLSLELGLNEIGSDRSAALNEISTAVAARMSRGASLSDALAAEGSRIPRLYRTLVEAGLRTQRLTAALESLTDFAQDMLELRRRIGMALIYPLITFSLAYTIFLFFLIEIIDRYQALIDMLRFEPGPMLQLLFDLRDTVQYWWWIAPAIVVLLIIQWWRTSRARLLDLSEPYRGLNWIPGIGSVGRNHRIASFCRLLAGLLESEVPLEEASLIAADATGDRELLQSARTLSNALLQGETTPETDSLRPGMPPFLAWLLVQQTDARTLIRNLRQAAAMYSRRARQMTDWVQLFFPVLAGAGIGGTVVLVYALTLFLPFIELLDLLSR